MISAVITTKNNADTLKKCLAGLSFCKEIIVIDSGSTDQTLKIAAHHSARIYHNNWPGYGAQKNFGLSKANCKWLLFIDADEEVTNKLAREIVSVVNSPQYDFYWLKITTVFLGKKLNHLYGHNLRLFKKSKGLWNNSPVHEQVIDSSGNTLKLKKSPSGLVQEPLLHHSHNTVCSYLKKMRHYTSLDARKMHEHNTHRSGKKIRPSFFLPTRLFARQLIKMLFYRRGLFDGFAGITWCLLSAYYEYELGKKYLTLIHHNKLPR